MYAVVVSGGKQFKVSAGDIIEVEKLDKEVGAKVELEVLMTVDGEKVLTGSNATAKVSAVVMGQGKGKKIIVYRYKAKKNERKRLGHRQPFTRIKIETIA